ncbi:hypothetical protein FACS1894164_17830 [Spirochaetia bacterium]|nr:hypothetical protein FACS1894164_17830 [Spirochaetia bacterium]
MQKPDGAVLVEWDGRYSVGVPAIDTQHKEFIKKVLDDAANFKSGRNFVPQYICVFSQELDLHSYCSH